MGGADEILSEIVLTAARLSLEAPEALSKALCRRKERRGGVRSELELMASGAAKRNCASQGQTCPVEQPHEQPPRVGASS